MEDPREAAIGEGRGIGEEGGVYRLAKYGQTPTGKDWRREAGGTAW
jgi:hypothetical protein